MKKNTLLKMLAEKGYDISFAANLNFATYDMVTRIPPSVSYISLAISIIGLVFQVVNVNWITIPILLLSIACILIERYNENIQSYNTRGIKNTDQLNELKVLYFKVKDSDENADFSDIEKRYEAIIKEFNSTTESDQILFANWFAHYKLFCEKDYSWMDEQIHFGFWKHKVPRTLEVLLIAMLLVGIVVFCINCPIVFRFLSELFDFCDC